MQEVALPEQVEQGEVQVPHLPVDALPNKPVPQSETQEPLFKYLPETQPVQALLELLVQEEQPLAQDLQELPDK